MKVNTELFLYRLLWFGGSVLAAPSIRNPKAFLEGGPFSDAMLRQIHRLERQELLEKEKHDKYGYLVELTAKGRTLLAAEDSTRRWQSPWDGHWNIVLFDISEKDRSMRDVLRRHLVSLHFGCLQKSLWISPVPQPLLIQKLKKEKPSAGSCTIFQARELLGLNPLSIVETSWDLKGVDRHCHEWEAVLKTMETLLSRNRHDQAEWDKALAAEFTCWRNILKSDPFLPPELQPKNYNTPAIWQRRNKLMKDILDRQFLRQ